MLFFWFPVPDKIPEMQKILEEFLKITDTNRQLMMTGPADNFKSLLMLLRCVPILFLLGGVAMLGGALYCFLFENCFRHDRVRRKATLCATILKVVSFDDHALITTYQYIIISRYTVFIVVHQGSAAQGTKPYRYRARRCHGNTQSSGSAEEPQVCKQKLVCNQS